MSRQLSYEDEQHKVRRYMTAPVLTDLFTTPPRGHSPALITVPSKPVRDINLAHYPEHVDHPMVWRAIREAVRQDIAFTWY